MKTDKIYLVGFMAVGKTTLAHALGARLTWRVEDLDGLIESTERMTIADIFARRGEPHFRALEREMLRVVLPLRYAVVATGGGTFADPLNRELINRDGLSIWIDVPFDELLARLPTDGRRPLASDRAQMARLYSQRCLAYEQAHLRLDARGAPVGELVERTLERLE